MNNHPIINIVQEGERHDDYAPFYSSLFTEVLFRRNAPSTPMPIGCGEMMLSVEAPTIQPHQSLLLMGSSEELGEWDVARCIHMNDAEYPLWKSPSLPLTTSLLNSEFKFAILDCATGTIAAWEEGNNRRMPQIQKEPNECLHIKLSAPRFNITPWKGAGVAIPLFSIRSEESMGVGDFLDLKKMVDWAAASGQKIIQILPINDTTMTGTWQDSYPYNANSIFALHPQYLAPLAIGEVNDASVQELLMAEAKRLNALEEIDYEAVNRLKKAYLRLLYKERGEETLHLSDFIAFKEENSEWLEPYALFSLLRDKYATADFNAWGNEACYSEQLMQKYLCEEAKALGYYFFVQYHLHCQLLEVRQYAREKGVAFKGDIPIGVSRMSVDVWVNPTLFHLNAQAGAPPDAFSEMGQNWGFPTYNWEEMAKDGYAWWNARFRKMATYFDAYRIDHILGFFRIWEIPFDAVHGLLGYFSPALPFADGEMQEHYGFPFAEWMSKPVINDWIVNHFFGNNATHVYETYLDRANDGSLSFKNDYDSQQKIINKMEDSKTREALLLLFNERLFVADPYRPYLFHPRISAQGTFLYAALNNADKACFNRLYNDFFYHRHDDFWKEQAMQKLPSLINATNMLTCGEDLGMIPHCVPNVMDELKIFSLEIQRMPKEDTKTFANPSDYPYLSVCTTSTHDMNPLRAWLLEDKSLSAHFAESMLGIQNLELADDAPDWLCDAIINQHLYSLSQWCILPLQDWLSTDESIRINNPHAERINIPANSRHYWRYRMHLSVEDLLSKTSFNNQLKAKIEAAGR